MPLFFFDVEGDDLNGREPHEFPDVRAAQGEALRAVGEIIRDEDGKLIGKTWTMDVVDERGKSVLTVTIAAEPHR